MQVLASHLPFLANRNAELAVPPLLWPVNCIKIKGHVALLSGPTVYSLYCAETLRHFKILRMRNFLNTRDRRQNLEHFTMNILLGIKMLRFYPRVKNITHGVGVKRVYRAISSESTRVQ